MWFVKFCAGGFSLDNTPWWSRPVEVDSNQIETLIGNNQHYTSEETDNILKISKSIKLLVKIKKCVFYFTEKLNLLFVQPNKCPFVQISEHVVDYYKKLRLLLWLLLVFKTLFVVCSFRFTAKLRGRYGDFPYTLCPHISTVYHYQHSQPGYCLLQLKNYFDASSSPKIHHLY